MPDFRRHVLQKGIAPASESPGTGREGRNRLSRLLIGSRSSAQSNAATEYLRKSRPHHLSSNGAAGESEPENRHGNNERCGRRREDRRVHSRSKLMNSPIFPTTTAALVVAVS